MLRDCPLKYYSILSDVLTWNMVTKPNAAVSFSSPISSTMMIDRSMVNTAVEIIILGLYRFDLFFFFKRCHYCLV